MGDTVQTPPAERRVGARVRAALWITVRGLHHEPRLVTGDVSLSGVFFEVDHSLGKVGSILALEMATEDRQHMVEVMAHLVREVRCDDLYRGETVAGVAFGFLFHSTDQRQDLEQFLRAIYSQQRDVQVNVGMAARITEEHQPVREAMVRILSLDGMVIETDWEVEAGESLQVEVTAPASQTVVHMEGQVVACSRSIHRDGTTAYSIQMQFAEAEARPEDDEPIPRVASEALEPLLEEITLPDPRPLILGARHMRGTLDQVGLASLLSFLELERRSCCLSVHGPGGESVGIVVRDGQVIDVQAPGQRDPREVLEEALDSARGDFQLVFQDVVGPDRVGMSTTSLLLDAARRLDERER